MWLQCDLSKMGLHLLCGGADFFWNRYSRVHVGRVGARAGLVMSSGGLEGAGSRDHFGNGNKFITPVVVKGKVYVALRTRWRCLACCRRKHM